MPVTQDTLRSSNNHVFTGFYFLAEDGRGIKMRKDHSEEDYYISEKPFVSISNISSANASKNIIQGQETYGVTIVLDKMGTKHLAQATGDGKHPYLAIVIANRLLYVVGNSTQIKTGLMEIVLVDYSEKEVQDMMEAIENKR
jgi:hypothetical protein